MKTTVFKIDLDLKEAHDAINLLRERIKFLCDIQVLNKKYIKKIELIRKVKHSCKIYYENQPKQDWTIILLQSILGDDYKRTAITFRDYSLGIKHYNRLFDSKRYPDGGVVYGATSDITRLVMD